MTTAEKEDEEMFMNPNKIDDINRIKEERKDAKK